jgi:TolB-like protein/DNA-binding winged helix-turn-helix (wHTH) protein
MPEPSEVREKPSGYEFGPFRVDAHGGAVYRDGARISLVPKAVDLLRALLEARGEVVTRNDLLQELWPDVVVEDSNISKLVFQLRQVLSSVAEYASAIETVPKRGYRFLGAVRELHGPPVPPRSEASPRPVLESIPEATAPEPGEASSAPHSPAKRTPFRRVAIAMIGLVGAVAVAFWASAHRGAPATAPDQRSIAILPLASLDDNPADVYFGDGLAEDLVTHLSRVPGLRVISRASTRAYRGTTQPLRSIAGELGVGTVIEGSVRRAGQRVRISMQLTETQSGKHLWAGTYDREAGDLLGVQEDIASKVAGVLALRLDRDGEKILGRGGTSNPEAYDLYLHALSELDRWNLDESMRSAIDHLERAVRLDPSYARAHAQLAWAYARAGLGPKLTDDWERKTRASADRALELEPGLALPHVAKSFLIWGWPGQWNAEGGIRELQRAQELEPSVGHLELGVLYAHLGLDEQSRRELDLALLHDPRNLWVRDRTIRSYDWLARWTESFQRAHAWFSEEEANFIGWKSSVHTGHADDVLRTLKPENDHWAPIKRALALTVKGEDPGDSRLQSRALVDAERKKRSSNWHHFAYELACIEALTGHGDEAVTLLKEIAEGGFPNYLMFSKDPFLDSIRGHPRFVQLMAELEPKWERWRNANP